jgi:hypothetical protein
MGVKVLVAVFMSVVSVFLNTILTLRYHAEQMLRGDIPSAKLSYIVEPWFLGGGKLAYS